MIIVHCPSCQFRMRIMGDADEVESLVGTQSEFWATGYLCVRCGEKAEGFEEATVAPRLLEHVVDVSPTEAFAALHGLGLPSERACSKAELERLLREHPIRHLAGRDVEGAARCYLDHLELWDGSKVYLGAGAGGALVYRITRPSSYAARVEP